MKTLLKLSMLLAAAFLISSTVNAQVTEEQSFEEFQRQENQNFQNYLEAESIAYEQYVKEEQEGLEKLRKEVEDFWGTGEFISSTKKDWVEYSEDKKSRSDVDFEEGVATVEVLLTPEEANNDALVNKKLEETVAKLVTTEGSTKDYSTTTEKPQPLEETPVLKGQFKTKEGTEVDESNADNFAKEIVKEKDIKKESVQGADGQQRTKVTVTMALAPDHIKIRAAKYENEVNTYASKYDLPIELVYAVIHTESYFNPKAKSNAPAYGLMQLVPASGARDAYQYVYKQDKVLPANYLYEADKNIELGTAYLQILMTRYFKKVTDPNSRMLCAIAAYNTGAGNVARAFTGTTNPSKAVPKINAMTYEECYGFLRQYLPHDETKDYVKKVSQRMGMYHEWRK
ncbi:MAG: murein transglycosylase domain-containing protein [Bacteroidales bacterium]|nr:murein transglycosylase domain-containing protein [Bacteroidales bacterium]